MRNKRAIAALGLCAALTLSSCTVFGPKTIRGEGEDVRHTVSLTDRAWSLEIEHINYLGGGGGVELHVDPLLGDEIVLEAPRNVLETFTVTANPETGKVTVKGDRDIRFADDEIEITVGVPLSAVHAACGIELDARLPEVKAFALHVDGAVDGELVFGELDALDVTINGAGDLDLLGSCAKAQVTVNGAGSIDAEALRCVDAAVTINGAGSCAIYVTGTLDATVNGVGSIDYWGDPLTVNRSGGGIAAVKEK